MTEHLDRLGRALADRYSIEQELGRGGMAIVYLAQDLKPALGGAVGRVHPLGSSVGPLGDFRPTVLKRQVSQKREVVGVRIPPHHRLSGVLEGRLKITLDSRDLRQPRPRNRVVRIEPGDSQKPSLCLLEVSGTQRVTGDPRVSHH